MTPEEAESARVLQAELIDGDLSAPLKPLQQILELAILVVREHRARIEGLQERVDRTKRKPVKPINKERRDRVRPLQYPKQPLCRPECIILGELAKYQRRHGAKMHPAGWTRCFGPPQMVHVVHARGMGGVNSSPDLIVYGCTGHHRELEILGDEAFGEKYGVDLAAEAAKVAAGDLGPLPPA